MGGDEFGILLHADGMAAMSVARRLLEDLGEPVAVGARTLTANGSIGVASALPGQHASEPARRGGRRDVRGQGPGLAAGSWRSSPGCGTPARPADARAADAADGPPATVRAAALARLT